MSPENKPNLPELKNTASIAAGVTMDNQILFDLFSNTIHAAEALNTDKDFIKKVIATRRQAGSDADWKVQPVAGMDAGS